MKNLQFRTILLMITIVLLVLPSSAPAVSLQPTHDSTAFVVQTIIQNFTFSFPHINGTGDNMTVSLPEADLSRMNPGKPVLPVNLTIFKLPFGTEIKEVTFTHAQPLTIIFIELEQLALAPLYTYDTINQDHSQQEKTGYISELTTPYPDDWVSYHTGGGLYQGNHTTFLSLQIYPVRYFPDTQYLQFIENISVSITVWIPASPILSSHQMYDLLILAPHSFSNELRPLVRHKNNNGVNTKLVSLSQVYREMRGQGRDDAEKIKYYITQAIEDWGVTQVLLVGGRKAQTYLWHLPVRYSHTVPYEEQEYAEQSFLSDLYFADVYDNIGGFSSWDSNQNDVFGEWTNTARDEMDLYPDVYLGRLPCLSSFEVRVMVNKIIRYEQDTSGQSWFTNLLSVAGDTYNDTHHFNEGELAALEAIQHMPGFTPVNVFASEQDINRQTVNSAMNQGCGFAYFVGHGNPQSWNTHFPPNGTIWCTGYTNNDMFYLKNKMKLPVAIIGGCHNGQFDTTMRNILKGIREEGFRYFSLKGTIGGFWYNEWIPRSWAWQLTVKLGGGAIATISNTGLGTHGDGDVDQNGIPDYLEILNGWMEIRFLQLYGEEHRRILGENHGDTLTEYLLRFRGNDEVMDAKMVQQWELFGDPSLVIGGYENT